MKKALVFVKVIFTSLILSAGEWQFELKPHIGILYGTQDEFVFTSCADGKTRKLSELNWELKPVFTGGIKGSARYKRLFLSAGILSALPQKCGTVYDSDWMNCTASSQLDSSAWDIKTNYSESSCKLESLFQASTDVGFSLVSSPEALLIPFAGLDYSYSKMHASGGTGWYATNNAGNFYSAEALDFYKQNGYFGSYELCDKDLALCSVRLERSALFMWLGAKLLLNPKKPFQLSLAGAVCPFAYIQSLDSHYADIHETYASYYLDTMHGFFCAVKGFAEASFFFSKHHAIVLSAGGMVSSVIRGTTAARYGTSKNGSYARLNSESGCSFSAVSVSAGYKLRF